MPRLTKLFWAYFLLLIFEGALRKWIVPWLSAPLLLVRDPVGLWIMLEAFRTNKWPRRWSLVAGFLTLALLILAAAQMIGIDNSWMAAAYGLRSYLLPFLVAFVMGENLTAEELYRFGRWTLWILLPMTALEVAQYLAPAGSFLNRGAYQGSEQIVYLGEHVRAAGTFSYVAGPTNYVPLAAAFLLYGLLNDRIAKKWLLWAAAGAVMLSIPVIGARTVVFELAGVVACMGISALMGVSHLARVFKIAAPVVAVFLLVSLLPIFSQAMRTFHTRYSEANRIEGGTATQAVEHRAILPVLLQIENAEYTQHPLGVGMGQGAAAITKLTTGKVAFVVGEGELGRVLTELGPVPGIAFMLIRLLLAIFLFWQALAVARRQEPLALLLAPLTAISLLYSVCEQPTEQGFLVIFIAFTLAALRLSPQRAPTAERATQARPLPVRYSAPSAEMPRGGAAGAAE